MADCFLSAHGECSDKISREHYLSAAVMKAIAPDGDLKVGGLAWQPPQTLQGIGIQSLQSKVLCTSHNSGLTELDAEATRFVESLIAVDKNPASLGDKCQSSHR